MFKGFRDFLKRGNVLDLAIGLMIANAFGPIAKSLVDDVIMPPIGLLLGGVDFSNLFLTLKEGATAGPYPTLAAAKAAGAVTMNLGLFVNSVITFVFIAFAAYLVAKSFHREEQNKPA